MKLNLTHAAGTQFLADLRSIVRALPTANMVWHRHVGGMIDSLDAALTESTKRNRVAINALPGNQIKGPSPDDIELDVERETLALAKDALLAAGMANEFGRADLAGSVMMISEMLYEIDVMQRALQNAETPRI